MILARVLIVAVQLGVPDALLAARAAFDAGNYEQAESLALAQAGSPPAGGALYLAGLARFRAGRPAEALEAIEAAALAPGPPERASWEFNRGACLYELGRNSEAEAAFLEAAALGGPIATVALANAGFAALDGGSPGRARELAHRASTTSSADTAGLVADLEAAIAGRSSESEEGPAREEADVADAVVVGSEDHARASARGLAGLGTGPRSSLHLESGYDDNVVQSSFEIPREPFPGTATPIGSAVGTTGGSFAYLWIPGERLAAEIAFAINELAFLAPNAEDYSMLLHGLASQIELSMRERIRVGAAILGHSGYTGLGRLRGMQAGAGARSWVAVDEGSRATTRLTIEWTWKKGLSPEFGYLTGDGGEALVEQDLELRWATLTASYTLRAERIGAMLGWVVPPDPQCPTCPPPPRFAIPLGHLSHAAAISAHGSPRSWLDLGAAAGVEWRLYPDESKIVVSKSDPGTGATYLAALDSRRRVDHRLVASMFAGWRLSSFLEMGARYDLVVSRSSLERPEGFTCTADLLCHVLDGDKMSYSRNQVTAQAVLAF